MAQLELRVLCGEDSAPIPGASVRTRLGESERLFVSDSHGDVALVGRRGAIEDVLVTAPGFAEVEGWIDVDRGLARGRIEVPLERTGSLFVRLRGWESRSFESCEVVVKVHTYPHQELFDVGLPLREFRPPVKEWKATCSSASVTLDQLPCGERLEVRAVSDGRVVADLHGEIRLSPDSAREVELDLRTGRITGQLVEESGAPLDGAEVWLLREGDGWIHEYSLSVTEVGRFEAATKTDARGGFEFARVPQGTWLVGPARSPPLGFGGPTAVPDAVLVASTAEETHDVGQIVVRMGGMIRGKVVDADGNPANRAALYTSKGQYRATALTDATGAFELGPLFEGAHVVHVSDPWGASAPSLPLELKTGDGDVVIPLRRGALVHAVAIDADTRRGIFVRVVQTKDSDDGAGLQGSVSGVDGKFTVRGLPGDRVSVSATTLDGRASGPRWITLEPGVAPEVLEFELHAGIRVHVKLLEGSGAGRAQLIYGGHCQSVLDLCPGDDATLISPAGYVDFVFRSEHQEVRRAVRGAFVREPGLRLEIGAGAR